MGFKLAEKVSDVTEEYILRSLKYHYPHMDVSQWSDKLIKRFHADFHNKALQNRWFFGDNIRVQVTIPASELIQSLRDKDTAASKYFDALAEAGYDISDPELLIKGKCKHNSQVIRISKAVREIREKSKWKEVVLRRGIIIQSLQSTERTLKGKEVYPSITGQNTIDALLSNPDFNLLNRKLTVVDIINNVLLIQTTYGILPLPKKYIINYEIPEDPFNYDISKALEEVKASQLIISQDINDFITASSGAFSSCFSIGKCYHFGWQQMWRTPFVWIAFTEKKLFHKTGRMWILQHLTHMNEPIKYNKALRFQKAYGQIKGIQKDHLKSFIVHKFNEAFKGEATFNGDYKNTDSLNTKFISSNIHGGWGRHAGYFDTGGDRTYFDDIDPFYQQPGRGGCMFMFADALDENGEVTTNSNFGNTSGNSGMVGVYPDTILVQSEVSKTIVDSSEAIQLSDGRWVSRKDVEALLSSNTSMDTDSLLEATKGSLVSENPVEEIDEALLDVADF